MTHRKTLQVLNRRFLLRVSQILRVADFNQVGHAGGRAAYKPTKLKVPLEFRSTHPKNLAFTWPLMMLRKVDSLCSTAEDVYEARLELCNGLLAEEVREEALSQA